ncbi:MAG: TlpA disulfide reductase family protein [Angelakisella sp.]|nr:TlpA disulfide reductase family protein [Angelakisella sp.]
MTAYKKSLVAMSLSLVLLATACSAPSQSSSSSSSGQPASSQSQSQSNSSSSSASDEPLLGSFTATDLDGNQVDQSIFENYDLTMINIWGTFCSPCIKEMPDLGEIHKEYADKKVQVVGIVIDTLDRDGTISASQVEVAKEVVAKTGADYLHILPSEDLINLKLYAVNAVPETIFVDSTGALVGKSYYGARSKIDWTKIINSLLESA